MKCIACGLDVLNAAHWCPKCIDKDSIRPPCPSCAEKDRVLDELAGMALTLNNALGDVACDGSAIGKYQMGLASRAEFIELATRRAKQGKEK
jgi:hypothetical protein